MKAIDNETYAVIENDKVVQIFTKDTMPEWDENTLQVVKIPMNKEEYVIIGTPYRNEAFEYETLESLKVRHISYLSWASDMDASTLLESFLPNSEFDTWQTQITEAKDYLANKDTSRLVFLPELAKVREMELETLCAKVIEKNTEYNKKLAKIVGYRQSLLKATQEAQSPAEMYSYKYRFIYYKPSAKDLLEEARSSGTSDEELLENVQSYGDSTLTEEVEKLLKG